MILTVDELRQYVNTEETDAILINRLEGMRLMIQRYCNNDFSRVVDESGAWPADIKMGVVNLIRWEL